MSLYRQNSTGFVCEFASSPGAGYTLISAQPTDTLANRVQWWRAVDVGSLTSDWHPSEIAGAEVPGRDTNAGKGVNILPNDYASFEWAGSMPPNYTSGMTVNRTAAATYHGQYGVRLTTTSAGGTAWLAASGSVFNIALSPSSKWIVSAYVRPLTNAAVSGTLRLKTQGGTTHSVSFTSGASSSGWVRVSGVFDLSADTSEFGQLGISLTNNSTSLDIDALMLEEKIGPYDTASVWYSPWGTGTSPDEWPPEAITQDKLFSELADRIDLIDASSLIPGSVNARLAAQYDTLVQQISEVSVGNGQFDSKIIWYFDAASEITGWTGTSASLAVSGGYLTVTGTGSNPKFKTATIAVDGSAYQLVRMRVKRTGGSGWTGTLRYYYSGGSDVITISEPAQIDSEYVEASWDMAGVALWAANTITAVEIQLGTASGDNYSIDWMGVGRNAPGASYSQVEAVRVLSDNKTRVFYETSNPTNPFSGYTLKINDLLFRTDQGYKPYRWTGSAWAETTDTRLADSWAEIVDIKNATANPSGAAAQRINSISATASSKNKTYYQASTSAPSSPTTGDLWFQTDNGNKAYRWSGSAWVETTDTRLPTAVSSISNIETAKIGYCTIGGNTSTHGDKSACEAAGGTWNVGLPWATAVKQVSITADNGQSATVQQQFETIYGASGLRSQYSIKLDTNGYTVGFGLYNEGAGTNGFIVRADKFVVGSAGSNVVPFEIVGTTTYIKAAMIQDASITSAKIGTLSAEKITGGYLDMARINAGAITADKIDSRGLSIKDASGNVILAAGTGLSSGYISAGLGGNQFPNADIGAGIDNWAVSWNPGGGTNYVVGWDLAGVSWAPAGGHNIGVVRIGNTQSATNWFDINYKKTFPVIGGGRYEASAYLASHRCDVYISVGHYKLVNNVETQITESSFLASPRSTGGQTLSNWRRTGGLFTAHADATYVKVRIRGSAVDAGQIDPFFWATRIFFGEATTTQTELTPWSLAGGSGPFSDLNQITASNASTYIANAAIDKAQIGSVNADTITTGTLNASLVNVTNLNAGSITTGTLNGNNVTVTNLNASNITGGTLSVNRIAANSIDGGKITIGGVDTANIKSGAVTWAWSSSTEGWIDPSFYSWISVTTVNVPANSNRGVVAINITLTAKNGWTSQCYVNLQISRSGWSKTAVAPTNGTLDVVTLTVSDDTPPTYGYTYTIYAKYGKDELVWNGTSVYRVIGGTIIELKR